MFVYDVSVYRLSSDWGGEYEAPDCRKSKERAEADRPDCRRNNPFLSVYDDIGHWRLGSCAPNWFPVFKDSVFDPANLRSMEPSVKFLTPNHERRAKKAIPAANPLPSAAQTNPAANNELPPPATRIYGVTKSVSASLLSFTVYSQSCLAAT